MKFFEEECVGCGKTFLNNHSCTTLGCPECEPALREEEDIARGMSPQEAAIFRKRYEESFKPKQFKP